MSGYNMFVYIFSIYSLPHSHIIIVVVVVVAYVANWATIKHKQQLYNMSSAHRTLVVCMRGDVERSAGFGLACESCSHALSFEFVYMGCAVVSYKNDQYKKQCACLSAVVRCGALIVCVCVCGLYMIPAKLTYR